MKMVRRGEKPRHSSNNGNVNGNGDTHSASTNGAAATRAKIERVSSAVHAANKGPVMPIGGAEERTPSGVILQTFVDLAGGRDARILICPTASSDPTAGKDYVEVFTRIGAKTAELMRIDTREQANSDECVKKVGGATGVFISGGDQGRLSKLMVGTRVVEEMRRRNDEGMVVGGTSAGASILSAHMMSRGESEQTPRKGIVELVAGFGFVEDFIIDQHFSSRGRIGRLLVTFAANPGFVGLGIDENTAVIIGNDGSAKAIGENSVFVVDSRVVYSDYQDRSDGEVLTISDSHLHILAPGRVFDLNDRRVRYLITDQTIGDVLADREVAVQS